MSSFNLRLEIPVVNYSWYQVNSDGTPKCPANWSLDEIAEFERYEYFSGNNWTLHMLREESFTLPFETGLIDDLDTRTFTFNHQVETSINYDDYLIQVTFSDDTTDFENLYFSYSDSIQTRQFDIPSHADYIKFDFSYINVGQSIYFHTAFYLDMETSYFDINTEQNDTNLSVNKKISTTISGKLLTTQLAPRDINYSGLVVLTPEEDKELNQLTRLAKKNKILISMYIDINDEAASNLANIASGGGTNLVKYYYNNHSVGQKSGLYSYLKINYKRDINSTNTYI